jgi:hypothetical protein
MWKIIGTLLAFMVVAVGVTTSQETPKTTPLLPATDTDGQREQMARYAALKAELADRTAKFEADRKNIIRKAVRLLALRKYDQLIAMENDYAGIHDADLNEITALARRRLAEIVQAKDRASLKKDGMSVGMTNERAY